MTIKLTKKNKDEPNPYRPDLPANIQDIDRDLFDFLRELAETLRVQHNMTQAGDSTFSWELLTQVDVQPNYNLGALGRFYHPEYGIIQARYCQFGRMVSPADLGPVGIEIPSHPYCWKVTNDFSRSRPDLCIGFAGAYVAPPEGSFGWVLVNGPNIMGVKVDAGNLNRFDRLVWKATNRVGLATEHEGRVVASLLGPGDFSDEIPPGFMFIEMAGDSAKRIQNWIDAALISPLADIAGLQSSLTSVIDRTTALEMGLGESNDAVTVLADRLDAEDLSLRRYARNLERRIATLESATPVDYDGSIGALTSQLNDYIGVTNGRLGLIQTQVETNLTNVSNLLAFQSLAETQLSAISLELGNLNDRVNNNMPSGVADQILRRTGTGDTDYTWQNLTAGIVVFTPTGGISGTTVQAAIAELDTEKQPLDSDLTAIAGLTTTAYGRGALILADAAAGRSWLSLGTSATVNTGTSGATIPLLNGTNTWASNQTFSASSTFAMATPIVTFASTTVSGTATNGYFQFRDSAATVFGRFGFVFGDGVMRFENANGSIIFGLSIGTTKATINATGLDVVGEVRGDTLRVDVAATAATPTPTHTFPISLNGTTYRVPCVV